MTSTGFVHPGSMGASLARTCTGRTWWASEGRSSATARRAASAGIADAGTLAELANSCDALVSICPPAAAIEVADDIAALGFDGIYVDANAIAPTTSRAVAERFGRFVDGAVIGPPVDGRGRTRMYLSGIDAVEVAGLWADSELDVRVIDGGGPASASALKMTYAAWTKGTSALLLAIRGLAEAEDVSEALLAEWGISQPDLVERSERAARSSTRAWRWSGEMNEIAASFDSAGLPGGFHEGAAAVYEALAGFKDREPPPALEEVIDVLLDGTNRDDGQSNTEPL